MKTSLSILATIFGITLAFAQATEKMSDQSVVRNSNAYEKLEVAVNKTTTNLQLTKAAENEKISDASITGGGPVNLMVVDLSVQDRVTITATAGLSSGTVSGSTFDGFYLKDFFSNAGTVAVPTTPGFSGTPTFTAASVPTNNIPKLYRATSGADPGLNIWGYSATATTTFTTGQQAFTGTATWTVSTAVYNAMLTAPAAGGDVYFVADSVGMLGTATLIGKYTVVKPPVSLLVVDLSVQNRVTITATAGLSSGTVSGTTLDGFYLKDFFSTAGTVSVPVSPGFSGTPTFTAASVTTNNNPRMYRATSGADPGLNIWGYSANATTTFTTGQQAFTGTATWTVSAAVYNAMLTAPAAGGDVYFVADSVGMLGTATMIGKYTVVKTSLAVTDANKNNISVYPNPFRDVLKISDIQNVKSVSVHDISGRLVKTLLPSTDLNLSTLQEGVYIVNLLMKDGSVQSFKQIKK